MQRIIIVIAVLLLWTGQSWAGPTDIVVRWSTEAWPGYTQKDGNGLYHELISAIFSSKDVKISVEYVSWKRAMEDVEQGNSDMTGGIERNSMFHQSRYPVYGYTEIIVFKKGKYSIDGPRDLVGKHGVWVRGYFAEESQSSLVGLIKGTEVTTFEHAMKMLFAGRADYFVGDMDAWENHARAFEGINTFQYAALPVQSDLLYMSFTKNQRGAMLREMYDQGFESLPREKVIAIYEKWGVPCPILEFDPVTTRD